MFRRLVIAAATLLFAAVPAASTPGTHTIVGTASTSNVTLTVAASEIGGGTGTFTTDLGLGMIDCVFVAPAGPDFHDVLMHGSSGGTDLYIHIAAAGSSQWLGTSNFPATGPCQAGLPGLPVIAGGYTITP